MSLAEPDDWPYDTRYCAHCEQPQPFEVLDVAAEGKNHDWMYCAECGESVGSPTAGAAGIDVVCANLDAEDAVLHNLETALCTGGRVIKYPDYTDLATAAEWDGTRLCEQCVWPAGAEAVLAD